MKTRGTRWFPTSFRAMFTVAFISVASSSSCGPGDCGYQAWFSRPEGVKKVDIRIQPLRAETLNGETNRGFQYIGTRPAKVQVRGITLTEKVGESSVFYSDQAGVDYYYEAPPDIDPRRDVIHIESSAGYTYNSHPTGVKESTDNYLALKR